ncbi:O-antigen ligase family protein [Butyrivibrio sp. JL13D10]|uniref:O-antigen ligase family protein n=1 Tax=Butyrivibrio sp. JL13D10 TaxID=3236815 RepID=UPI0038B5B543
MFKNRYIPSRMVLLVWVYYIYLVANSFLAGNKDIHLITSSIKILALLAVIDMQIQSNQQKAIEILYYVVGFFCMVDAASIIFFPDGLYQLTTNWNEWSYSISNYWIFGHKNNHAIWFILFGYLTYLHCTNLKKDKAKIICFFYALISVLSMVIIKSSTSLVVIVIVNLAIYKFGFSNNDIRFETKILLYISFIINVLVIFGFTVFLQPIVELFFNKDLTFSGRTLAWQNALFFIAQKPFFGWGIIPESNIQSLLGSIAFVNAHNQILQSLFQGGIILLLIIIVIFIYIANSIDNELDSNYKIVKSACLGALLIELVFEVRLDSQTTWILILVISQFFRSSHERIISDTDLQRGL